MALLVACDSGPPDTVSFRPANGESRRYLVSSEVQMSAQSGLSPRQNLSQRALFTYHIRSAGNPLRIDLMPEYMTVQTNGQTLFRSSDPESADDGSHVIRALMEGGFHFSIDRDSGRLVTFEAGNQDLWQAIQEDGGLPLAREIQNQLYAVSMAQHIPAHEGAQISLNNLPGSSDISARVEQVTPTQIELSLHSDSLKTLYGKIVLERRTGWLRAMALSLDEPQPKSPGTPTRLRLYMAATDWQAPPAFIYPVETLPGLGQAGVNDLFFKPLGVFRWGNRDLYLRIAGKPGAPTPYGMLTLDRLQLLDGDGNPLDVKVPPQPLDPLLEEPYYDIQGPSSSGSNFYLKTLGWRNDPEVWKKLRRIEARLRYHPVTLSTLTLPVNPGGTTTREQNGAKASISSLGDGNFRLLLEQTENTRFLPPVKGLTPQKDFTLETGLPGGIRSPEDFQLATLINNRQSHLLHFDKPPKELQFLLAAESSQVQEVPLSFVSQDAYDSNPHLPPGQPTVMTPDFIHGEETVAPLDLEKLEPTGLDKNRLSLTLPGILNEVCHLDLIDPPKIQGHPLTWVQSSDSTLPRHSYQIPAAVTWELRTDDGVQRYFYGLDVQTRLSCKGVPSWKNLSIPPSDEPWLIDLQKLLGEMPDPRQPVAQWMRTFRFLDADRLPLSPVLASPSDQQPERDPELLGDYLVDGHFLRLGGMPVSIERLDISSQPIQRRWKLTLPPLPLE